MTTRMDFTVIDAENVLAGEDHLDRLVRRLAIAAALTALAGFGFLHGYLAEVVDPVRQPVSSYALTAPGEVGFAVGAIGMAVACGALALRFTRRAWICWPLVASSGMYVLVVLFPTDAGVAVSTVGGQIHRYAAGVAFVAVTVVAIVAAWRSARSQRMLRVAAGLAVLMLLVTTINTFLPELADGGAWRGVPQRALLVIHIGLFLVLSRRSIDRSNHRDVAGPRDGGTRQLGGEGEGTSTNGAVRWGVANWPELMAMWANMRIRDSRATSESDSCE
ncbi:uncharacterized protein DUF998 [Stackebrandtia endophytica]|uniref:Uncharacterized protein DUF998 n=1 Tax=Stackebrandtia endophytica TaxID=1496996 RepID=A0A543AV35_9ACTN|nr:uncharacterized protein DUF998 [Stackebrandtia endophytica]